MKGLFSNRVFLSVLFFILGGFAVYWAIYHINTGRAQVGDIAQRHDSFISDFFSHDFFSRSNDPFTDIQEISQREDDKFIYFDIVLHNEAPKEIAVNVIDGQVTITGTTETQKEQRGTSSFQSTSFTRSFPAPAGVDANNFKMEQEGNKIVLKFPKVGEQT